MVAYLQLVIAIACLSHGFGRARAERVEDEGEAAECEDVLGKNTCPQEFAALGEEYFCRKHHHKDGLVEGEKDPDAYGLRINFESSKSAGKTSYKYGGIAYAGGRGDAKNWEKGCCAKTCNSCYGPPGTAKPKGKEKVPATATITKAKTPDATPKKPEKVPATATITQAKTPDATPKKPEKAQPNPKPTKKQNPGLIAPEMKPEPELVAQPMPMATPKGATPKASAEAKGDPSCTGEVWCREWHVDPMGGKDVASTCKETNNGRFFASALKPDKNELKQRKKKGKFCSEFTAGCKNVIEGWCCWSPLPRFPGPKPCDRINKVDYYPSGKNCDQDMTCPKLYALETATPGKAKAASCYPKEKGKQECK